MGYLRRNLYNPNLIEIPDYTKVHYTFITDEEREFINKYMRDKLKNSFFSLENMSAKDISILSDLSRFLTDNPSIGILYSELERIFVECIFDGNKEMGMKIYYKLKYSHDNELYISFSRFFDENEQDLVRFLTSKKKDFNEYLENDINPLVYIDGEKNIMYDINVKDNPIDYYLNKMFITQDELVSEHKKILSLKNVDDKK